MEDSYAFVMNVARLVGGTGFALGAGYELRRANTEESAVIKETLQRGHGTAKNDAVGVAGTPLAVLSNLWRRRSGDITLSASEGPTKVCWRLREIEEAFNLAQLDLEIGLTFCIVPDIAA
jgi:hypothetical protein